jgi:hypothetical protein
MMHLDTERTHTHGEPQNTSDTRKQQATMVYHFLRKRLEHKKFPQPLEPF